MTFAVFDVVVVPFPYSDRLAEKRRPALVVSATAMEDRLGRLWVAMITTDRGQHLHGDARIEDLGAAGLPSPSIIRASKIATIEVDRILRPIGRLATADAAAATEALNSCAGF